MQLRAIIFAAAVGATGACDDTPRNEYAAACKEVFDNEMSGWMFAAHMRPAAGPFCGCFGTEISKEARLDAGQKARLLTLVRNLGAADGLQPAVAVSIDDYMRDLGEKRNVLSGIVKRCRARISK